MCPKVSIVVPMYDVEKYLEKCINSLIHQTLKDIEIILVDDGSPDRCGEIAEQYAKKDTRIKVIHQNNAGLGPARNTGMEAATGEYIGFVDSDDWVKPDMFAKLLDAAYKNSADIVASGHCDWTNGKIVRTRRHPMAGKTIKGSSEIDKARKQFYGHLPTETEIEAFPMSVWISIYRRKMLEHNNLKFINIISEDIVFNISAYNCAQIITFTEDTDYCYRKETQTSITQSFSNTKLKKYEELLIKLIELAKQENDQECMIRIKRKAMDCCRLYVGQVGNADISFKEKKYYVELFAKSELIKKCWENYPIESLPLQQKIFQKAILSGNYGIALLLNSIRQTIKRYLRK